MRVLLQEKGDAWTRGTCGNCASERQSCNGRLESMKFLRVSLIALLAIAFVVGSTGCKTATTTPPPAAKKLKVAFVYPSPHNDGGWSQAEEAGRLYLQQNDPNVETIYSESVPEGSQAEKTFRDYASAGYNLIFGASFGYMDAMVNAAKDNPTVKFMHSAGYKRSDNLGTYFGRIEQSFYLSGLIAGKMTKTNTVSYTHLRAHETRHDLVCRLLLEKKKKKPKR